MGHIVHHAIIVTSWDEALIRKAHRKAKSLGASTTSIVESNINSDFTFLIGPDGSKSGWAESDTGDERREAWIAWAKAHCYEDGSSALSWCEVEYGSDDRRARASRHAWLRGPKSEPRPTASPENGKP